MGRRTCTLLPTAEKLSDTKTKASNLAARKRLQCRQYNRGIRNLAPLKAGHAIRMKLLGEKKWSLGHCTRPLGRRSYEVGVEGRHYRRYAARWGLLWRLHQYQAAPLMSLIRLRMKENLQLYQSPLLSILTPRHPRLKWMMQSPQRNLSQTQIPSQLSSPDVLRKPDVPQPGLKIMTSVEHLNIDLKILRVLDSINEHLSIDF